MGPIAITCWNCGDGYEVADGADLRAVKCPRCKNPPTNTFRNVTSEAYEKARGFARQGDAVQALGALEDAIKEGFDLELIDSDPALGKLRGDPRFALLLGRYRPA